MPETYKLSSNDEVLKKLSVMYVDSDRVTRAEVENKLQDKFLKLVTFSNAEDAMEEFKLNHYDLVMTDYFLSGVNGLAFARDIRAINDSIPVIMVTSHIDRSFLMAAINMGISQFVAKPIHFRMLNNAIVNAVEKIILHTLRMKTKEQQLELLEYKEARNNYHLEFARRKELSLIKNDQYMRYFTGNEKDFVTTGWNIDTFYETHEIASGDIYSCRRISDDSLLMIIIDAMGKGVSAAITSTIAISIFNYLIDMSIESGVKKISFILEHFIDIIKGVLLDDEMLSLTIARLDLKEDKLFYAAFSMPKICVATADGSIKVFLSNNMPILKNKSSFKVNSIDLKDVNRIMICSDGLVESTTTDGNIYLNHVEGDFKISPFIKDFETNIRKKVNYFEDDTSIFFIRRTFIEVQYIKEFEIETRYSNIEKLEEFFVENISSLDMDNAAYECFYAAYSEIIMNAYEHGNLGISNKEKYKIIQEDIYEDTLLEKEKDCDKKIKVRIIGCKAPTYNYVVIGVRDEGNGYPDNVFGLNVSVATKFNGRGLKIISYYTDDFFFSEDRKEIFIVKTHN